MTINWETALENLTITELANHMITGPTSLTGSQMAPGFYEGKGAGEVQSPCQIQHWILDNTPYSFRVEFGFEAWRSDFTLKVVDKETGELVKQFGPEIVKGRDQSTGNFAMSHEKLGALSCRRFAEWAEGLIQEEQN